MATNTPKVMDIDVNGQATLREMTAEEIAQREADKLKVTEISNAMAEKAATKAAVLARLGLTEDELKAVIG